MPMISSFLRMVLNSISIHPLHLPDGGETSQIKELTERMRYIVDDETLRRAVGRAHLVLDLDVRSGKDMLTLNCKCKINRRLGENLVGETNEILARVPDRHYLFATTNTNGSKELPVRVRAETIKDSLVGGL